MKYDPADFEEIQRFTGFERIVHWVMAVAFIIALLTGMGVTFPQLHWLITVFGGNDLLRYTHPISGIVFSVSAILGMLMWIKDLIPTGVDFKWAANILSYVTAREENLPDIGKYNFGQKMFGLTVFIAAFVMLISGWVMWYPEDYGVPLFRTMIIVHMIMFILVATVFFTHLYMGSLGVPGSLSSILHGKVTRLWAKSHHALWLKSLKGK